MPHWRDGRHRRAVIDTNGDSYGCKLHHYRANKRIDCCVFQPPEHMNTGSP
jgi:hypothetical protein